MDSHSKTIRPFEVVSPCQSKLSKNLQLRPRIYIKSLAILKNHPSSLTDNLCHHQIRPQVNLFTFHIAKRKEKKRILQSLGHFRRNPACNSTSPLQVHQPKLEVYPNQFELHFQMLQFQNQSIFPMNDSSPILLSRLESSQPNSSNF